MRVPFSILDVCPVSSGSVPAEALRNSIDLVQRAEAWGFHRYWVAEHHNMTGIASAATAVVVGQLAASTSRIRVGSGGIMLPNHAPLLVAEQFGTLECLFPGRIDLGLGRAPGADPLTMRALRRGREGVNVYARDVEELRALLADVAPEQELIAVPGAGTKVPLWLLGSSLYSAELAARMGLPFAFASHFAPRDLQAALAMYRQQFVPSCQLNAPHVMVAVNVCAADTTREAMLQFTTTLQAFTQLQRGRPGPYPPPCADMNAIWSPIEKERALHMLEGSVVGSPAVVEEGLRAISQATQADELILQTTMYEHAARVRSYEIVAEMING